MCAGGGRPAVAAIILRVVYCHGDGGAGRRVCCVCVCRVRIFAGEVKRDIAGYLEY